VPLNPDFVRRMKALVTKLATEEGLLQPGEAMRMSVVASRKGGYRQTDKPLTEEHWQEILAIPFDEREIELLKAMRANADATISTREATRILVLQNLMNKIDMENFNRKFLEAGLLIRMSWDGKTDRSSAGKRFKAIKLYVHE
jgi:hypothetical protein